MTKTSKHMSLIVGKLYTPCHEMYLASKPDPVYGDVSGTYWPSHVLLYLGPSKKRSEAERPWLEFLNCDGIIVGGFFNDHLDIGLRLL